MEPDDRALCAVMAARLRAQEALAAWGLAASALVVVALLLQPVRAVAAFWLASALLAAAERYLALRVRLDASLFDALATGGVASPASLDRALARIGLRRASAVPRTLEARLAGTRALLRAHLAVVAAQTTLAVFALAAASGGFCSGTLP
jgi:hypothetical protein